MLLFFTISFVAGVLTVLAPCVLPLLPVIIGGSVAGGSRKRAYTVIASLIVSVIAFTLLIKVSSVFLNVAPDTWKYLSGIILGALGITMLFPKLWESLTFVNEISVSSNKALGAGMMKKNFIGDVLMGAALGPVFSTCSPTYFVILATVLPSNFTLGLVYLLAYSVGLGLALLAISIFGQKLADKLAVTADTRGAFKKSIGVIFIVVALLIVTGYDKKLESFVTAYVFDVTKIEQMLLQSREEGTISVTQQAKKTTAGEEFPSLGVYHEITNPAGYVNTNNQPVTIGQYIGKKIILIDFMTYSCINCVRTFPYLIDWNTKYSDKGLVIIGIHTPEFAFEKVQKNVEKAMKDLGITFPVVLDNSYGTWNAYGNQYWPRKYIIDLEGNIVYDHIGEGKYQETEEVIQKLLKTIPGNADVSFETKADDRSAKSVGDISPESYLGYGRIEYSAVGIQSSCADASCDFIAPSVIPQNRFAFGGKWTLTRESALGDTGATLTYNATAKKVYLVAGPAKDGDVTKMEVYVDGVMTKTLTISSSDLYTLVDGVERKNQKVMIKIISGRLLGYAFTFG